MTAAYGTGKSAARPDALLLFSLPNAISYYTTQDYTQPYIYQSTSNNMGVEWRSKEKGQEVPSDAILGGKEPAGEPLYIARAYSEHHGESAGLHPGKFGPLTGECALFGFEGEEWYNPKCEILCGDQNSIKWLDMEGSFPEDYAHLKLVEGGKDAEGNPLFCAQVETQGSVIPGKAGPKLDGATASFDGKEFPGNQVYKVLAYA